MTNACEKCARCGGVRVSPGKLCDPCIYMHGEEYARIDQLEAENARLRAQFELHRTSVEASTRSDVEEIREENARLRERAKRAYDLLGWCMQLAGGVLNGETGQLVRDFRAEHDDEQRSSTPTTKDP